MTTNDNLVLISGKSATGKSASLQFLKKPEGVMYLNTESGKKLPFKSKFKQGVVTHPKQVMAAFEQAEADPKIHTIVIDSLNFLMDMYESKVVLTSTNTMKAWSGYAQYFKTLMQHYVASSTKNVIMIAHTHDQLNEAEMVMETYVPIKGALKNQGIEAYFSLIVSTKKVPLKRLEDYANKYLIISPEDEAIGIKYVFQTRLTKETVNERIRGPMKMWEQEESFIDNDAQKLLDHVQDYYK